MDWQYIFDHIKMVVGAILTFLFGITLDKWVGIVTVLYFVMQIGLLMPKYKVMIKHWWDKWFRR